MRRFPGWPTQYAGEAKVAEFDDSWFGEEDVLWLYITVDALQDKQSASRIWQHDTQSLSDRERRVLRLTN